MMIITTTNAPPRLRGRLSAWLLEIRAGIYVGKYSRRTRQEIWNQVVEGIEVGDATMCWTAKNDQGFDFITIGANRRMPKYYDGMLLVEFLPPPDEAASDGGSDASRLHQDSQ